MKMTTVVRTCMLVMVLAALGTTTVFGQIVYNVGSPNGTPYNGAFNYNFAANREGNAELFPAITICANTPGVGGANTFDAGDVYKIEFFGNAGNSPVLKTQGALGGSNLLVSQQAVGLAATFTATAAMVTPPVVGPAFIVGTPIATITLTVATSPLAASGINCVTIQNLRFDIGNTLIGTLAGPPAQGTTYGVTVTQIQEGLPVVPIAVPEVVGNPANAPMATGMPALGNLTATAGLATVRNTFSTIGATGFANATGFTTGNAAVNSTNAGINLGGAAASNPSSNGTAAGGIASTFVSLVQNSGSSGTGTISVAQNTIAVTPGVGSPNLPVAAGGGLFRGFTPAGPDVTTFLNMSGATTGTQLQIQVSKIPAGATVTFPATVATSSGLAIWQMSGGGTLSSPGGTITYSTTINEGTPYSLDGATAGLGPSIEIPYTVTEASSGGASGVAQVILNLGPTTAQGGVPSYSQINGLSVMPSQVLPNVGQWALFRIAPNTSTRTYPYVLVAGAAGQPSSYDTGIVLENTGKGTSGTNSGQDGTFTVYLIGSTTSPTLGAPTVVSIASTATGIPNAGLLTAGALAQGGIWQALASEILKGAGVTTDWRGYIIINANFPNSSGFAFISQFANPGGGATMGYIAQ